MKNLLFITSRPIYPIVGGDKIRTYQSLQLLKKHFNIHVVVIGSDKDLEQVEKYNSYSYFCIPKWKHYLNTLRFLFNNLPLQVNYYYDIKVQQYIDNVIDQYDVAYCNNIRTAEYVRKYRTLYKIIDFVDAISMNYKKARKHGALLMRMIYNMDFQRCSKYESMIQNEFDSASVISIADRNFILNNSKSHKELYVIGNATQVINTVIENSNYNIVFVGKMNYAPNVLAVTNFANKIFPVILNAIPNAVFYIVGVHPTKDVLQLGNGSNIIVTGFVEDIGEYLNKAAIVVAPMISGAGIQNKIIQAMGRGNCVVTTSIGAEGLNITHKEIAVVDGNVEMARIIIALLKDEKKRIIMGIKAKKYVKDNLSLEAISMQFNELIKNII